MDAGSSTESMGNENTETAAGDPAGDPAGSGAADLDTSGLDLEFTARDLDVGYEETTATKIRLEGTTAVVDGTGASWEDGMIRIEKEGTYVISGTLDDGEIVVQAEDTEKVQIVLNGASVTCADHAALYIPSADKVFVTLADGTENRLSSGETYQLGEEDSNVDGVIFSRADLTLNGTGSLTVEAAYKHAVVSKDDLVITGGTYVISAPNGHGLQGKDCVKIADGTFTLNVGKDGIQSDNEEDENRGFVYLAGGTFSIHAGDDAVHAEKQLIVEDGVIGIESCYEGLEGLSVTINGGEILANAKDDGINAAGGNSASVGRFGLEMAAGSSECRIEINGGIITVRAAGDGLDSNGTIAVNGGTLTVSGMAQNFSGTSGQPSLFYGFSGSHSEADAVTVTDTSGAVLMSAFASAAYQCVVVSCPESQVGETYTITAGSETAEVTLESMATSAGTGGMGGFGGQKNPGGFGGKDPQAMPGGRGERGTMPVPEA